MKRINAIKKLLREGYTERLLSNLDDNKITNLYRAVMSEQQSEAKVSMSKSNFDPRIAQQLTKSGVGVELKEKNHEDNDNEIISFSIPDWAVPTLINGDSSGLSDEDEEKINSFVDEIESKFGNANFMLSDDDELELGFCYRNDIDNLGSNCMKLLLKPSKNVNESLSSVLKDIKRKRNLFENKYFHNFTTKGEIVSLIKSKLNEQDTMEKIKLPSFFTSKAIKNSAKQKQVEEDTTTKPTTKPKEKEKEKTRKNPFNPGPKTDPGPQAKDTEKETIKKPKEKEKEKERKSKNPFNPGPKTDPGPQAEGLKKKINRVEEDTTTKPTTKPKEKEKEKTRKNPFNPGPKTDPGPQAKRK
jgi:hypothetical protein